MLFGSGTRRDLATALDAVFVAPATLRLGVGAFTGPGRDRLEGQMLILPLIGDGEQVNRALGALSLVGEVGRTPRQLMIRTQSMTDIAPVRGASDPRYAAPDRRDG